VTFCGSTGAPARSRRRRATALNPKSCFRNIRETAKKQPLAHATTGHGARWHANCITQGKQRPTLSIQATLLERN